MKKSVLRLELGKSGYDESDPQSLSDNSNLIYKSYHYITKLRNEAGYAKLYHMEGVL